MKIIWVGAHGFSPYLGEVKLNDEREVGDAIGRRLIKDGLAEEVVAKKAKVKAKEDDK